MTALNLLPGGEGAGSPSPNPALTPATGASPSGGALCGGPELRLLMRSDGHCHPVFRWATVLNDWPGQCPTDHWHYSETAALECFRGEGR